MDASGEGWRHATSADQEVLGQADVAAGSNGGPTDHRA